jgi:hypothetical protein
VKPLHGKTLRVSAQTHLYASDVAAKGRPSAIAQQAFQLGAVSRGNAYGGINREAAVLVGQHVRGVSLFDEAAGDKTLRVSAKTHLYSSDVGTKGAQDALASAGLHLGNGGLVGLAGRVKTKCQRAKIDLNWYRRIYIGRVCCRFRAAAQVR